MDLVRFLSDWLTYAADNVKASVDLRVWKMFWFYFIKTLWNGTAVAFLCATCTNLASQIRLAMPI